jgi:hypothetical protein
VTGVQTCALPICSVGKANFNLFHACSRARTGTQNKKKASSSWMHDAFSPLGLNFQWPQIGLW